MSQTVVILDLVNSRYWTHTHEEELQYGFPYQTSDLRLPRVLVGGSSQTIWQQEETATSDGTYGITRRWQSALLAGGEGQRSLTVNRIELDYLSANTSSLTVRVSASRGASWAYEQTQTLPATSVVSRVGWDCYVSARYPVIELQSSATTHTLWRADITMNVGGR